MAFGNLRDLVVKTVLSKDGTEIHAEAIGNPSNPHVVFVHGMACTSAAFDPVFSLPEVQAQIYAVRYDNRAHGRSGKPETEDAYETHRYAEDFMAVVEAFALEKPVYCGWSLAGTISADLCTAKVPLAGLVYLSSLPYIGDIMPLVGTPLVFSFVPGLTNTEDAGEALRTRIEFCKSLVAPERLARVPYSDMLAWVGGACHMPPKACDLGLTRKQDPTALNEAGKNGLPLLIVHGTRDLQIDGEAVIANMAPRFKDCESVLLDGLGHMPFYEDPEGTVKPILRFVNRVSKRVSA